MYWSRVSGLRGIGVDGKAVEILLATGQVFRLHLPFLEGTVQVMSNRTTQMRHFRQLVVVSIQQVGGKILAAAALRSKRDHVSLPSASMR